MRTFRVVLEIEDKYDRYEAEELLQDVAAYPNECLDVKVVGSSSELMESDEDAPHRTSQSVQRVWVQDLARRPTGE